MIEQGTGKSGGAERRSVNRGMGYIGRKIEEFGSAVYRAFVFPFKKLREELGGKCVLKQGAYFNKGTRLCGRNYLGRNTYLTHVELGFGSYVSEQGRLMDTRVGKYCSIGPHVYCAFGLHPAHGVLSTHPAFYSTLAAEGFTYAERTTFKEERFADEASGMKVIIGNDVWIGARVTLTEGIRIGDGAIVAAGALVLTDIEPYAIYAGVPARKISDRLTLEQQKKIQKRKLDKWWEKSEDELRTLVKKGEFGHTL